MNGNHRGPKGEGPRIDATLKPIFLRPKMVERLYGISRKYLNTMRHRKEGPPYWKVGGRIYYEAKDVELWIRSKGRKIIPEPWLIEADNLNKKEAKKGE